MKKNKVIIRKTAAVVLVEVVLVALALVLAVGCSSSTGIKITLDTNYEGGVRSTEITNYGQLYYPKAVPEREGFVFEGWSKSSLGSPLYEAEAVTAPFTLYAVWSRQLSLISVNVSADISAVPVAAGDRVETTVLWMEGSQIGTTTKKETVQDPSVKVYLFKDIAVMDGEGIIKVQVIRTESGSETVIGARTADVEQLTDGASYTVSVELPEKQD